MRLRASGRVDQVGENLHTDLQWPDGVAGIGGSLRRRHHHPIAPVVEQSRLDDGVTPAVVLLPRGSSTHGYAKGGHIVGNDAVLYEMLDHQTGAFSMTSYPGRLLCVGKDPRSSTLAAPSSDTRGMKRKQRLCRNLRPFRVPRSSTLSSSLHR
jgi:hypothetical protein